MYNLSPSFNWGAHGFTNDELKSFIWDLGKAGYVLQLISLAGLHSTAVVTGSSSPVPSSHRVTDDEGMISGVGTEVQDGWYARVRRVDPEEREGDWMRCPHAPEVEWSFVHR